ncbi:subtilisin-like protease SBT1.5 [Dendrobium catenatum]|uniref:Subtilisin-like protease SDD1 n=1 Tax=Dendrobium catenatum TaxID=906689 RepID=A0A2I0WS60_9ASPA|nr:subtilisin-like protease SBT1.5 [Dendrobium catenatum]PKU78512.1 Subtilisin-like protease SDD1 [Dendrobium catenatum]
MAKSTYDIILPILLLCFLHQTHMTLSLPLLPITSTNQTRVYIVHVQHPNGPTELLPHIDRESWYHSFLPNATLDSGEPRMVYTYSVAMSGFAARLTPDEVRFMESIPGFLYAYIDKPLHLHTTHTPTLLGLDQYNSLWQQSDRGEGVIIGVLDSGITPDHPSFIAVPDLPAPPRKWHGSCNLPAGFSCTNKLIGAEVFLGGVKKTPIDETGHGTHVAGIAAGTPVQDASVLGQARGTASGMAPRAHIASYRVCTPFSCSDSNILKGFDQAIQDGVDLIQISIGGVKDVYYRNGIVKGSFAALTKGILTVNSAGNDGPAKSTVNNDVPWILQVGAANIDRRVTAVLRLDNGMEFFGMSAYQPDPSTAVDLPLVYPGVKDTDATLACERGSMAGFDVVGKMVLCGVGHNDNIEKAKIVKAAGGAGIIVMNQRQDAYTINADPYVIPAIHVSYNDAIKILNYLNTSQNATGTITFKGTEYGIRPSPAVASFSSRGPSLLNGGILKPDVIAPGVNILSAWPFEVGKGWAYDVSKTMKNFTFEKGTSMAAPHVSGVAALLKDLYQDWSPAAIKSAIMTTTYIVDRNGGPIIDDASNTRDRADIFAVGAGHINPTAASDPGLVYDVTNPDDYIPYLCSLKGYITGYVELIVKKYVNCKGKEMGAEQVNYPSIQVSMGSVGAEKKRVKRTVKNVGEASSIYKASVVEPRGVKVVVTPETLQFSNVGEEKNFTVELSLTGKGQLERDDVLEGRLNWVSGKRVVSSPIVVTA